MKFTVGELFDLKENLNKLPQIKDPPALVGYKIASLLRHLNGPLADAEKARVELIKKYAGPPDENNMIKVLPENMTLYINELNELASEELDIDVREVKLPPDIKLPDASTLIGLDRFITV